MTPHKIYTANLVLFLALADPPPAHATWSIVAVDPETREVGLAAATCGPGVQFIAAAVPEAGVVASQAKTSFKGRDQARDWITEGIGAEAILERLAKPALYSGWFNKKFPDLQYGVATLTDGPQAGFTGGNNLMPWSGGKSGVDYSAQGNTLRGGHVIAEAARVFEKRDDGACRLTLGERLLRALEAGRNAGGDSRCPLDRPALSAILITEGSLTGVKDKPSSGRSLRLVSPREIGLLRAAYYRFVSYRSDNDAMEPVQLLRKKFKAAGGISCHDKIN